MRNRISLGCFLNKNACETRGRCILWDKGVTIMEYQYGQNNENNNYQSNNDYIYYHSQPIGNIPPEPTRKKKEKKSGRGLILICLVLSLLAGCAGGALGSGFMMRQYNKTEAVVEELRETMAEAGTENNLSQTTEGLPATQMTQTAAAGLSVKQITEMCMPSVVAITNKGESEIRSFWGTFIQETEGSGSGVIIGKTDTELLIVTNYHVVSGSKELSVLFSYQEGNEDVSDTEIVKGEIKDYSSAKDLAVVAVDLSKLSQETMDNIKVATLGDSDELSLGDQVVAIGNALGYGQSVTTGIVSAVGRSVTTENSSDTTGSANEYIQTDAAINPGNSGGAMFNMKGELVGINSAKVADTTVEGIGYAIPISDIKDDMERMMQQETRTLVEESERGYFGISVSNVTNEINQAYDIPIGAYISSVTEGSPAEKAGLQRGMVITELDGRMVRTREELVEYLGYYRAGETVTLTVEVRTEAGYEERQIAVTLYTAKQAGVESESEQSGGQSQGSQSAPYDQTNPFGGFFPFFNY